MESPDNNDVLDAVLTPLLRIDLRRLSVEERDFDTCWEAVGIDGLYLEWVPEPLLSIPLCARSICTNNPERRFVPGPFQGPELDEAIS